MQFQFHNNNRVLCYHSGSMDSRRRLVSLILLNVLVSALVTGTILFFYDRAFRADCGLTLPVSTSLAAEIQVEIVSIAGARDAASEVVTIKNSGDQVVLLTGWYLRDSQGLTYTFPQLTLHPGALVQLHTGTGDDSATDLYWGRTAPVWTSGELAGLYDTRNIARAFYRVP